MLTWLRSSTWWIPLLFAVLTGSVGLYSYRAIEQSTHVQLERELQTILDADVGALMLWVEVQKSVARAEARRAALLEPVLQLKALARSAEELRPALLESAATREVRRLLLPTLHEYGFANFAVLDRSALVLADSDDALVGRRLAVDPEPFGAVLSGESSFTRAVRDITGSTAAGRSPARDAVFYSAAPIRDDRGRVVAVLAFVIGTDTGFSEILQIARMGESGETYAFDEQGLMLSQSRFVAQLVELGLLPADPEQQHTTLIQIRDPGGSLAEGYEPALPLRARPLTRMAAEAVTGASGSDVLGYRDYRGVEVIGAWTWLPQLKLGVTSEIDRAEAYTGLDTLQRIFAVLAIVLLMAAVSMFLYTALLGRLRDRFERVRKLGRYEIVEKIGQGGMGTVYRARHALLRRPTAIKLLESKAASGEAIERFEREVQASSSLTHPNTISIFDYGRTPDGTFYYAMEFIDGITIGDLVEDDGAQPEARVVYIMRQAAASLAEAHDARLVHRDLKPSNIMLCTRGGMHDFVKVLDFGLVRSEERSQDDLSLTSIDSLTGTPLYISPEALEAPETVSARSDIYQLGAIAYYLLTGDHVFNGKSLIEVLSKHLNQAPVSPSEVLGRPVSPDLEAVILAALDKDPAHRPENGAAFLAALDRCKVEGVWTLAEARAWWSDYAVHLEEHKSAKTSVTSALPTGWQVDLDGRQRFGSS